MNVKTNYLAIISLFIITVFTLINISCTCPSCRKEQPLEVPLEMYSSADSFLVSKVGKDFLAKYIHADYLRGKRTKDKFKLRYRFIMPEYSFVNEEIIIVTDTLGKIINPQGVAGIPTCAHEPDGCTFYVTESESKLIAEEESFPKGIRDWEISFRWAEAVNKYTWHVLSVEKEFGSGENYKASGREIYIDSISGEILKEREWEIK
ncbi:MAG: hypothetical protein KJ799_10135 [Bacteroidetes bacterium]|nr:hypothetical protein [Bacteroidota bacterium]MBU2507066.1 hypothetical protein [Bacteroidota bacterium]